MKRFLLCLLSAAILLSFTGCSEERQRIPFMTTEEEQDPSSTISSEKEDLGPSTAVMPPALRIEDLPAPVGNPEIVTDAESGTKHTIVVDAGADGRTKTTNCFDENGDLEWWTAYEYSSKGIEASAVTRGPDNTFLWQEDFFYDEDGIRTSMNHVGADRNLEYSYEYYQNGATSRYITYHPNKELSEIFEYDEEGKEIRRAVYSEDGALLQEFVNGKEVIQVPETLDEVFALLNEPCEDFERVYQSCMEAIEERRQQEEWGALCSKVSATFDYLRSPVYQLYEVYKLKMGTPDYSFDSYVNIVKEGIQPQLLMTVYSLGNHLDGFYALWLPKAYASATSDRFFGGLIDDGNDTYQLDWSHPALWQFVQVRYGVEAWRVYTEAIAALPEEETDENAFRAQITELVCTEAGVTDEELLSTYTEHIDAERERIAAANAHQNGDPIRILILDESDTVRGDTITADLLMNTDKRERILSRAEEVWNIFPTYHKGDFDVTSYPDLADVIIELNVSYPYAGRYYYSDGTPADVYNTVMDVTAIDTRDDTTASVRFSHIAGDTVSVSGGTEIYMYVPRASEEEWASDAAAFADQVFAWYAPNE